ncbi:putative nuclease HARBI1 [Nymphon striatum]|nr:putative nuclease HARBI1 [Nymphon striatum]
MHYFFYSGFFFKNRNNVFIIHRHNPIDIFNDDDLVRRYRFSLKGIMFITDLIVPEIEHPTRRNHALLPYQQVVMALKYYATKTFQMVVSDPIQISQPTSCQVVNRASRALAEKIKNFVKFPEQGQVDAIKDGFYRMKNFLSVLGCVDGPHVWIISPHLNETDFVNKGYHSINVQVICDHKGKWINIVSVDVSLMTVVTPEEIGTRVMVEQDIGRWKRRFHIHLKNWMNNPESACRVIAATAVLHNIALDRNEPGIEDTEPGQEQPDDVNYEGQMNGPMTRNDLIPTASETDASAIFEGLVFSLVASRQTRSTDVIIST